MSDARLKNSQGLFKHSQDDPNSCLSSTKNWVKQPLAAKIYQKGTLLEPVQTEFTIDLNTRSNQELPVPLSKLEQTAEIKQQQPYQSDDGNYFLPFRLGIGKKRPKTIVRTEYLNPKNKLLKQKGICLTTGEIYDGFIFQHSAAEEQDYQDNVLVLFPLSDQQN